MILTAEFRYYGYSEVILIPTNLKEGPKCTTLKLKRLPTKINKVNVETDLP
jgi:hypothetical protein